MKHKADCLELYHYRILLSAILTCWGCLCYVNAHYSYLLIVCWQPQNYPFQLHPDPSGVAWCLPYIQAILARPFNCCCQRVLSTCSFCQYAKSVWSLLLFSLSYVHSFVFLFLITIVTIDCWYLLHAPFSCWAIWSSKHKPSVFLSLMQISWE